MLCEDGRFEEKIQNKKGDAASVGLEREEDSFIIQWLLLSISGCL